MFKTNNMNKKSAKKSAPKKAAVAKKTAPKKAVAKTVELTPHQKAWISRRKNIKAALKAQKSK